MKIKVCGMRDIEQVKVLQTEVDFIGFIRYTKSLRYSEPVLTKESAEKVGVYVNGNPDKIRVEYARFDIQTIQLHGDENPEYCRELSDQFQIIKAFGIHPDFDFSQLKPYENVVDYFLFDNASKDYGGSGTSFSWEILDKYNLRTPFFLSGGIGPESLDDLLQFNHSNWIGIDLNSRFEHTPANKNIEQLKSFIYAFRASKVHAT